MRHTDLTCPEDGCEKTLRVRDHGRPSGGLRDADEIETCVALKNDGERCTYGAREGERTCGVHDAVENPKVDYAAIAWEIGANVSPAHPYGDEFECPHHGIVTHDRGAFPEHVRKGALS